MNTFEYLSIAYALVFSATALRLIGGLSYAFGGDRSYWIHTTFVVAVLLGTVLNFWAFLGYRDTDWNLARFALTLMSPGVLYFVACSLVPDDPGSISSWEGVYYAKRTQLFSGLVAWGLVSIVNTTALLGMPALHPTRSIQIGLLIIGVGGLSSARHVVHRAVVCIAGAVIVLAAFILFLPGSIAQ